MCAALKDVRRVACNAISLGDWRPVERLPRIVGRYPPGQIDIDGARG